MKPDYGDTARAFDAIAPDYDAVYGPKQNAVMTWMRQESLAVLGATFPRTSTLLEIGCGTGEEAVALARAGRRVVATDISPKMTALTLAKARAAGLGKRVAGVVMPAGGIGGLRPPVSFDGAYASFGALNCEPDLAGFGRAMGRLVRPGGGFICSVMARFCPFEVVWFLLRGRPRVAFRRMDRGWQSAPVAGRECVEVSVATRYLAVRDLKEVLSPAFELERTLSLPLLLPPPYLDGVFREHRRVFAYLERWERRLRHRWPWRIWGDHVVLVFRRLGSGP
jgi:SAM-dependent methyltransferase